MLDLSISSMFELLKIEPGGGMLQSVLLFMIWLSARGLKKEVRELKESLTRIEIGHEVRIGSIENQLHGVEERVQNLERGNK